MPVRFSTEDLRTPEGTERVLRQFAAVFESARAVPALPSLSSLAASLAPLLRAQLEAKGSAPLNLQSLLPGGGSGGFVTEGTHAARLALYPPGNQVQGALFWETDRRILYVIAPSGTALVWQYAAGMYHNSRAGAPADLGVNDAGFLMDVTDFVHIVRFDGTLYQIIDTRGGYFVDSATVLGTGWQLCDGSVTSYLDSGSTNLSATAFTTPNEVPGVYHRSIAVYTGVVDAPIAPIFSGTPQVLTGTVDPVTATGDAALTTLPGAGQDTADNLHTHPAPALTMDSYTPAGTVGTTGEPRSMGVVRYFRR